jgi:Mn2+/Fe2+ NRAMP family transporter
MMIVGHRRRQMGEFVANRWQLIFGWAATVVMGAAVIAMLAFG